MILQPNDHRFTFTEMVGDNPTDAMNVRNWMARGVISIGLKHKLGRWLFSVSDIIRLRVVRSLIGFAIPPAEANKIADLVVERYHALVVPEAGARFPMFRKLKLHSPEGRQRLFVTSVDNVHIGTVNADGIYDFAIDYNGRRLTFDEVIGDSIHLMVPMDELIARTVMNFTIMACEEAGEEWYDVEDALSKGADYNPYANATSIAGMMHHYLEYASRRQELLAAGLEAARAAIEGNDDEE
jgi:hypothetical protein